MLQFLESLIIKVWNRLARRQSRERKECNGLVTLGLRIAEGQVTNRRVGLSPVRRTMHQAYLGKTGTGKSSLLKFEALQDIRAGRGFLYLDLHGDATPFLLSAIAAAEWERKEHLSDRLIVISPADSVASVGLNPLGAGEGNFVSIAEIAELLTTHWKLEGFGARTDELLRNALFVLASNGLTLVELSPLLTHPGFRTQCLKRVQNAEVKHYFESRYGKVSEPMRATMREPILNKVSAFTADPRFRHIVGQAESTFSMRDAMDNGCWIIVELPKGRLGPQALTMAGLVFTIAKQALFTRAKRSLFSLYCDEVQNYIAHSSDVETILSEARKFAVGVISANQFLDQYPSSMRSAILSVGTLGFFQLSSTDAAQVAQILDGGKPLAERLKNLPQRHFIVKTGSDHWVEACVPKVEEPRASFTELLNRSRTQHARPRVAIEHDIAVRHASITKTKEEALHDWD